jgi:outer membrane biosynthesis protein TonB
LNPRLRKYIIIFSVLLHIVILMLFEGAVKLNLIGLEPVTAVTPETEPIVFDLQQPQQPKKVVETPDDAKIVDQQKNADYLSDKNALARNPDADPNAPEGDAYSKGIFETHELPVQPGVEGDDRTQPRVEGSKQGKEKPKLSEYLKESDVFSGKFLQKEQEEMRKGQTERLPTVLHNNTLSKALDRGGLSFNTYNWDFAPYMIGLKAKIRRNIFPPLAFTQLGLIDGETLVKFRIYPNGDLRLLKVLDSKGHKTLMETSVNAVKSSAPFEKLPENFPEDYLEVTGKFIYFVGRPK